jgi:hypothetical protein
MKATLPPPRVWAVFWLLAIGLGLPIAFVVIILLVLAAPMFEALGLFWTLVLVSLVLVIWLLLLFRVLIPRIWRNHERSL